MSRRRGRCDFGGLEADERSDRRCARREGDPRRSVPRGARAPAGGDRAGRSSRPRGFHRRDGAAADLCGGRPRDHGTRRAAARLRVADRLRCGGPASQHGRERDRAARRHARRPDRCAAAAALASRGRGAGAVARRGARADLLPARRRYRAWRSRDAHRDGDLHDPLPVRLRRTAARRRRADRRHFLERRRAARDPAARHCGGSRCAGDVRRHGRGDRSGRTQPRGTSRGGPRGHARSRHRAGRSIARRARARLVRLHRDDHRAVAVERRDLGVASAVRAGCLCPPACGGTLHRRGAAGPDGGTLFRSGAARRKRRCSRCGARRNEWRRVRSRPAS